MTIDASVGGASSDSYSDVADADTYHGTRLHNSDWTSVSTDKKERALKWATRILDREKWLGSKSTTEQALRWPRTDTYDLEYVAVSYSIVPQWLKDAVAEFAMQLLVEDRTADSDTYGFESIKADVIEIKIDKNDRRNVIPDEVMELIKPYIEAYGTKVVRT